VLINVMSIKRWEFALPPERLPNLEARTSLEEIALEIVSSIRRQPPCCQPDPLKAFKVAGREDTKQFRRIIYCVTVDRPLFDRFFNSPHGYRGAYFRDPFEGLRANHLLLSSVAPALLDSPDTQDCRESRAFIRQSLTSISAKAWLAERDENKERCDRCAGEWSSAMAAQGEIRNGWEVAESYARWGSSAPYLTRIKFCGAFLRETTDKAAIEGYEEVVPALKRHRASEIHERGWS
jgi:hypothetical protein